MIDTSRPEYQIVPFARFAVSCACGYGHDSYAETGEQAVKEIGQQHRCPAPILTAEAYAQPH